MIDVCNAEKSWIMFCEHGVQKLSDLNAMKCVPSHVLPAEWCIINKLVEPAVADSWKSLTFKFSKLSLIS
jgi:hypothetical protein